MLQKTERHGFALSPTLPKTTGRHRDHAHATAVLGEIFYYMDRIMQKPDSIGVWTRSTLIANFAGCLLEQTSLPVDILPFTNSDGKRLIAFLFCAFLIARGRSVSPAVSAEVPFADTAVFRYRLEFEPSAAPGNSDTDAEESNSLSKALSKVHGFRVFHLREENKKLILEADLLYHPHCAPAGFHAFRASRFRVRIILG